MSFGRTSIIGVDPRLQFVGAEQAVWLGDGAFAMHPFRFDWVEPGTLAWQQTRHDPHSLAAVLDRAVVKPYPVADLLALVPRGIVPDQQQALDALHCQPLTRPRQKVDRDGTDWSARDKAQQHLVGLLWSAAQQQPVTGQRLRVSIA